MMYTSPVQSRPIIELAINNMLKTGLLFVWIEAIMFISPDKAPKNHKFLKCKSHLYPQTVEPVQKKPLLILRRR